MTSTFQGILCVLMSFILEENVYTEALSPLHRHGRTVTQFTEGRTAEHSGALTHHVPGTCFLSALSLVQKHKDVLSQKTAKCSLRCGQRDLHTDC